jgi:hypothetical protein
MAEQPTERTYTVEEANAELEDLRRSLARIREARRSILRTATSIRERAPANGGGEEGAEHWEAVRTLRQEVEGLSSRSIILRDADTGLIDFPSRREGRQVYLCWRPDEEKVSHWHDLGSGFGGRKEL